MVSSKRYSKKMRKPNIIFILMDACRRDHLGCYGYGKPTSPNIDALAKESVVFDNAFSVSNSTTPCLTSIFSGYSVLNHGIIRHLNISKEESDSLDKKGVRFLPEILKEKGYCTMAFDWLSRWHKKGYDFYEGIGDHKFGIRFFRIRLPYDTADTIIKKARKKIKENMDRPFFVFMHFWDTHSPYSPPTGFIRKFRRYNYSPLKMGEIPSTMATEWMHILAKDANEIFSRYDGAIRFVDSQIGRLIGFLKKEKLYDNTMIIVMADHGEDLIDHNNYFDHHSLYENVVRIPFIIKAPGVKPKRMSSFFQQSDITPTILDNLGVKPAGDGKIFDLKDDSANKGKRSEVFFIGAMGKIVALRDERHKYIYELKAGLEEAYDIKKDPHEKINLINKKLKSELRGRLGDVIMKTGKIREKLVGKREIVYNKLHYAALQKRIEFLERELELKNKELEKAYGKKVYRLISALRRIKGKVRT